MTSKNKRQHQQTQGKQRTLNGSSSTLVATLKKIIANTLHLEPAVSRLLAITILPDNDT